MAHHVTKKLFVVSLGCSKNRVDTEVLLGIAEQEGWKISPTPEKADLILINTCAFITPAKEESIETILELSQFKKPSRKLVVAGCLPQRHPRELKSALPEVDAFLGTGDLPVFRQMLKGECGGQVSKISRFLMDAQTPRKLSTPPYTAFLKLSEGCSDFCAFCAIPRIRGALRSRPLADVIQEVERLLVSGVVEINLIGQNLTAYGDDLKDGTSLLSLIKHPVLSQGRHWVRLHYLYPKRVTKPLLEAIAHSETILPYIDIPIQHIDSAILKSMKRLDTEKSTRKTLELIREILPQSVLRTSLIVGFPGETEARFERLLDFVKEGHFDRLGAFVYSQEEGTLAAKLPGQVSEEVKQERLARLMEAQRGISQQRLKRYKGKILDVLVEGVSAESELLMEGRFWGQAAEIDGVCYLTDGSAVSGEIVPVRITDTHEHDLVGKILSRKPKNHHLGPS